MRLLFAILLLVAVVFGAPASPSLEDSLRVLQEQVTTLQKEIQVRLETSQIEYRNLQGKNELLPANSEESRRWQPEKRMVAWQPMKRTVNVDERAPLLHAIEARLSEVLRAGERLGVSADEVLADLRVRNSFK